MPLKLRAHAHESGGKPHQEVHLKDDIIIENKNIAIIINDNIANKDTVFLQSPGKLLSGSPRRPPRSGATLSGNKSDLCSSPLFKEPAPHPFDLVDSVPWEGLLSGQRRWGSN